jgi:hypothetical protein
MQVIEGYKACYGDRKRQAIATLREEHQKRKDEDQSGRGRRQHILPYKSKAKAKRGGATGKRDEGSRNKKKRAK